MKEKGEHCQQSRLDSLRDLPEFARDTVAAKRAIKEVSRQERGKAAFTELFESVKSQDTPIMVERIVADIDEVVRPVRFDGGQDTA